MQDWYVGEIYKFFSEELIKKYTSISFEIHDILELQKQYNIYDYSKHGTPSFFNKYNFIIHNSQNNKTFINSLHDYAPLCLHSDSGVENFDVQCFGFSSNYRIDSIESIKRYNPTPSFYVLEHLSDLQKIEEYKSVNKNIKKIFFLGLMHSSRPCVQKVLKNNELFDIKDKSLSGNYKHKKEYFEEASKYSMHLGLDGAAKICYRDLEAFGLGSILIRENLNIQTFNPIIPNEHYVEIITEKEKSFWCDENYSTELELLINNRLNEFLQDNERLAHLTNNGREWYYNNCLPDKQFNILEQLTRNLEILS